jgi:hypothetical protein
LIVSTVGHSIWLQFGVRSTYATLPPPKSPFADAAGLPTTGITAQRSPVKNTYARAFLPTICSASFVGCLPIGSARVIAPTAASGSSPVSEA